MVYLQFFPKVFIQLQEELTHHPELQKQLNENNYDVTGDFVTLFTVITNHVGVQMVGDFTPQELEKIAEVVVQKLKNKRTIVVS